MDSLEEVVAENGRLRRAMRDLVALSTLPAIWFGHPIDGIASGLAQVLLNTLSLDLVYIRLSQPNEKYTEVLRTKPRQKPIELEDVRGDLERVLSADGVSLPVASVLLDERTIYLAVTRFGVGEGFGVLVTGSRDAKFPTETDRLLLGVGANQTAIVLQHRYAEDQVRQMATDLAAADRRKNEFLATLAHELRNPLAPIRTGLQLLNQHHHDEAAVKQTRLVMDRQLSHLVRLVDDLMDVSRITSGKIELRRQHIELATVVNSAIEGCRPLVEQMQHTLDLVLPADPLSVDADLTRLAQIFANLITNAAKYSAPGGRIQLVAERRGSELVVSVKDSGIGIAAEHLSRIFEMFSQVDRSLEKSQGGLGIGLTLVKRLVELHGGTINALSEGIGKGSEFVLRLPIVIDASRQSSSVVASEPSEASRLRILIVDDNADGADLLAMLLESMGNEIHIAYDGEQAVAATAEFQPDVVLLDLGLPKLNGYEACRLIRQQSGGRNVLMIAQTGWGQAEDRQRTREAGFDHHLVKPLDPQALRKLLAQVQLRDRS